MPATMKINAATRLRSAKADVDDQEITAKVTITGSQECVERVLALLYLVDHNGKVGHSGTFAIGWDGDGSDRVNIEGFPDDLAKKFNELANTLSSYGGQVEQVGQGCTGFVLSGDLEGSHYLKSKRVYPETENEGQD